MLCRQKYDPGRYGDGFFSSGYSSFIDVLYSTSMSSHPFVRPNLSYSKWESEGHRHRLIKQANCWMVVEVPLEGGLGAGKRTAAQMAKIEGKVKTLRRKICRRAWEGTVPSFLICRDGELQALCT